MSFFKFSEEIKALDHKALEITKESFKKIEEISEYNSQKVLKAFTDNCVSEPDLGISTGYGYGDQGRDKLDKILSACFGTEDALIRHSFASGTHTLSVALFGILRPGDKVLCVTGRPYDTIIGVFGIDEKTDGSLADFGIGYSQVDLKNGRPDIEAIKKALNADDYKMAYIQRSRGYSLRPSLSIADIKEICDAVRSVKKDTVIMVDNCYGEFVEKEEPCNAGADLFAGSLIKNAGGGIARSGGYIAGKAKYIEMCAARMTCAGVGREVGASLGNNRELYMGLFAAPHTVGEALKTAVYASAVFEELGMRSSPTPDARRTDIIQALEFGTPERMVAFCQAIQAASPIDSMAEPEPWDMPGYADQVIMAAGAFVSGASIELSADGPMRAPYAVYLQGGLTYGHGRIALCRALEAMQKKGTL